MTLAKSWAGNFRQHGGPAHGEIDPGRDRLPRAATLTYQVRTTSGKGDFGGTEIDEFEKVGERWKMLSWEKVP